MGTPTNSRLPKAVFGLALSFIDAGLLASAVFAPLAGWLRWTVGIPLAAATTAAVWATTMRFRWWWAERREIDPYLRHLRDLIGDQGAKR